MFWKSKPLWGNKPRLKSSYDAVIIGGGLHGLATAYYLAKEHGITDVAIIEKRYIGFGGAGRNTAIVRANQRTQYNVPLYKEALDLWPVLTKELDFNLMFNNCGNLNLMHSEAAMKAARMTIATAQFHGVESHLIDAKEAKELVPALNISEDITFPIHGAMFHPPGGIVRHDAVVWGLAKGVRQTRRAHPPADRSHRHPHGKRKRSPAWRHPADASTRPGCWSVPAATVPA
jgi:sarcosine oxidase subunit beta